jgi:hypothetical protein
LVPIFTGDSGFCATEGRMDMSAFKHAKRESQRPSLAGLLARITSQQAVSATARATMSAAAADPSTASSEPTIDQLIAPKDRNLRDQTAPVSFNSVIAEALVTRGKAS